MVDPQRVACVWCLDWPIVAAGIPPSEPGAVLHANRVVASSEAARSVGVVRGLRRREAQGRCPELVIAERDLALEVRTFEEIAAAIEAFTPRLDIMHAGTCVFPTIGPSRYFGGDHALGEKIHEAVTDALDGRTVCNIGIADGIFSARLASRAARGGVCVIESGGSPEFLAPLSVSLLEHPELTDVLWRLGIRTLGAYAELDAADVLGRFGNDGLRAHQRASGRDEALADVTDPPEDMAVTHELDPPAERIEHGAFAARQLAIELHDKLERRGAACTRVTIIAESEHGEHYVRGWRHEGALSVAAMTDRIRWQLDGWLNAAPHIRPTGGLARLVLRPDDCIPAAGRQLGFWGGETEADQRAGRAVARLESLLGVNNVQVAEFRGGRDPADVMRLLPAGTVDLGDRRGVSVPSGSPLADDAPWPGAIPAPSPVELFANSRLLVVDGEGNAVVVDGRGAISASPQRLSFDGKSWRSITAWAGPWLLDERWWDPERARRRARFQFVDERGNAVLAFVERGEWWLAGAY